MSFSSLPREEWARFGSVFLEFPQSGELIFWWFSRFHVLLITLLLLVSATSLPGERKRSGPPFRGLVELYNAENHHLEFKEILLLLFRNDWINVEWDIQTKLCCEVCKNNILPTREKVTSYIDNIIHMNHKFIFIWIITSPKQYLRLSSADYEC